MRKLVFDIIRTTEKKMFGKYLLLTNTVSSGVLMYIGEIIAQSLDKSNRGPNNELIINQEKVKQLTVVGISQGPLHHFTYLWMERLLPGNSKSTVTKKIISDQLIVSPIFIAHYFYTAYFLAGSPISDTNKELFKDGKFLKVYVADWAVWPAAQLLNFLYVPLKYRVLYINAVTMFYNIFLCYVKNLKTEEPVTGSD